MNTWTIQLYGAVLLLFATMMFSKSVFQRESRLLSSEELRGVRGTGAVYKTGLCLSGAQGSYCNRADEDCSVYDPSCSEQGAGALCSTCIEFFNPTRCTTTETTKQCADEDTGAQVVCYTGTDCYCELLDGALVCKVPRTARRNRLKSRLTSVFCNDSKHR